MSERGRRIARIAPRGLALACIAAAAAPAANAAERSYPQRVAGALRSDPVYVDKRARPPVSVGDAGRIRIRIVQRDLGRIKMAIVPDGAAAREGGVTGLAHAIDRDLQLRGTLIVVAGSNVYAVTSYEGVDATIDALKEAFGRREGHRTAQLLAAVDGVAAVDPGPEGDPKGSAVPPSFQIPDISKNVDDAFGTARLIGLIVALSVAIPFVAIGIVLLLRYRRSRKEAAEDFGDDRQTVRDRLIELGDGITALEIDASMPGVTASAVADYEAAVSQYDRANTALERADSPHRLAEASTAVTEGLRRIESVKQRLAAVGAAGTEGTR